MTKRLQVYRCAICGNIVEVVHEGRGQLTCCKQPMKVMKENTVDAAKEKHVPVIEKTDKGVKVKVGSVEHPMEDEHYIEWIELLYEGRVCRKFLGPDDAPEAEFAVQADEVSAREYCSLHGLWRA
jgi:superoxide reductase